MKIILEITDQFMFCLASLKCSKEWCMREFIITYRKTKYYIRNNLAFSHSTEHAIIQLIDQLIPVLKKNHFRLGVFAHLPKAFDTVDHHILVDKLENYVINGNNLHWFQSYFKNRKPYLNFSDKITTSSKKKLVVFPKDPSLGLGCS